MLVNELYVYFIIGSFAHIIRNLIQIIEMADVSIHSQVLFILSQVLQYSEHI